MSAASTALAMRRTIAEGQVRRLEVSQLRRLKQLEEENRRLKQIVGELTLDNAALKEVVAKRRRPPRVGNWWPTSASTTSCRNGGRVG